MPREVRCRRLQLGFTGRRDWLSRPRDGSNPPAFLSLWTDRQLLCIILNGGSTSILQCNPSTTTCQHSSHFGTRGCAPDNLTWRRLHRHLQGVGLGRGGDSRDGDQDEAGRVGAALLPHAGPQQTHRRLHGPGQRLRRGVDQHDVLLGDSAQYTIPGQGANCWSEYSATTGNYYLSDPGAKYIVQ